MNNQKPISLREMNSDCIGKLISVRGVVAHCSGAQSMLAVASYSCYLCDTVTYQAVEPLPFMPVANCSSGDCRGELYLQARGSKFVTSEEITIQEQRDEIPSGQTPHSLTILFRGEVTHQARPGDHVIITGIFMPLYSSQSRKKESDVFSETFLDAHVSNSDRIDSKQ